VRQLAWSLVLALVLVGSLMVRPVLASASTHVGQDPYASGCAVGAYMANSADVYKQGSSNVKFTVENWYSPACLTNWAVMTWPRSNSAAFVEIHTKGWTQPSPSIHQQCYRTSCVDAYTGQGKPMWTDMIEGQDVACIFAYFNDPNGSGVIFTTTDKERRIVGDVACA
jgi:hypothetical protein